MNSSLSSLPFVLLFHEVPEAHSLATGRGSHWDFMVATDGGGLLRTWALGELPDFATGKSFDVSTVKLPDHRREYLAYEGEVSGGRGTVARVALGVAEWLGSSTGAEKIRLHLDGGESVRWIVQFRVDSGELRARFERQSLP